jgi:hypothetical protein
MPLATRATDTFLAGTGSDTRSGPPDDATPALAAAWRSAFTASRTLSANRK